MKIFNDNIALTKDNIKKIYNYDDENIILEIDNRSVCLMFESKYETRRVKEVYLITRGDYENYVLSVNYNNGDIVQLRDGNTYSFMLGEEEKAMIMSIL